MFAVAAGFLISLAGILIISKKNLALGLMCGAIILGLFTLSTSVLLDLFLYTISDLSVLLLALAMGVIPLIGGTMKESGQIDSLVNNLRMNGLISDIFGIPLTLSWCKGLHRLGFSSELSEP